MSTSYLWLKYLHIFIAVIALGTSAGLGIVLEFYGKDAVNGSFALRVINRMLALVVVPGYLLMLATGLWMASMAWPFTARWIQVAMGLWGLGIASLAWSLVALRRQQHLYAIEGPESTRYAQAFIVSRVSGAIFGLVVAVTLYLMVFKP